MKNEHSSILCKNTLEMSLIYLKCQGCIQQRNAMTNHDKKNFHSSLLRNPERQQQFLVGLSFLALTIPNTGQGNYILIDSGNQSNKTASNNAAKRLKEGWLKI